MFTKAVFFLVLAFQVFLALPAAHAQQVGSADGALYLTASFTGIGDEGGRSGEALVAASMTTLLTTRGSTIAIRDKSGTLVSFKYIRDFLAPVLAPGEGDWITDTDITFDPESGRFFFVVRGAVNEGNDQSCQPGKCVSSILIAVSKNDTPTKLDPTDWYLYSFDRTLERTASGTRFVPDKGDEDRISVVGNAIIVGWIMVNRVDYSQNKGRIRVFEKAKLIRGEPVNSWIDFTSPEHPRPAASFGSADAAFLDVQNRCENGNLSWVIGAVTGLSSTPISPQFTTRTLQTPYPCSASEFGMNEAPQRGGGTIEINHWFAKPVYRNGSLWVAETFGHTFTTQLVSVIRWVEIDVKQWPDARIVQSGILGEHGVWSYAPAFMVDAAGNFVLVCIRSSSNEFASTYYAYRLATDQPGTLRPATLLKAGTVNFSFPPNGIGRTLFVTYTGAAFDPVDGSMWLAGLYASPNELSSMPSGSRTWIGNLASTLPQSFAQFANGGGVVSSLTIVNPSSTRTVTGYIRFSTDEGQPYRVSLNGEPPGSTASFTLRPFGSTTFTTAGTGTLLSGSAKVSSIAPISGMVRFSIPGLGATGVGGESPLVSAMMPVIRDTAAPMNTGIAIANAQAVPVDIRLSLRNLGGSEVVGGSTAIALPGNGHMAKFVDELFPNASISSFQGILVATALTQGGRISVAALQLGDPRYGEFSTLPVISVNPMLRTTNLVFPQFVAGNGWVTSVFLMSPSSGGSGEISFFGDSGAGIGMSVGNSSFGRIPFAIASGGGFTATSSHGGQESSGSARVNSIGVVGGMLRFSHPSLGMAGVSASEPTAAFIAPVARSVTRGLSAGIAFAAFDAAVAVTLTLRGRDGRTVAGAQATVRLPAKGHIAKMFEELFPNATMSEFEGVATAIVDGGTVAAVALEIGSSVGTMTVLPVSDLK